MPRRLKMTGVKRPTPVFRQFKQLYANPQVNVILNRTCHASAQDGALLSLLSNSRL